MGNNNFEDFELPSIASRIIETKSRIDVLRSYLQAENSLFRLNLLFFVFLLVFLFGFITAHIITKFQLDLMGYNFSGIILLSIGFVLILLFRNFQINRNNILYIQSVIDEGKEAIQYSAGLVNTDAEVGLQ